MRSTLFIGLLLIAPGAIFVLATPTAAACSGIVDCATSPGTVGGGAENEFWQVWCTTGAGITGPVFEVGKDPQLWLICPHQYW